MPLESSGDPFRFEVWPTEYRKITQHFGANPLNYAQFGLPGHDGIDIRAPSGSKVFCVAAGEVYKVHKEAGNHNYGIHVRVNHAHGYQTVYAHLQKALVREGLQVAAGHLLGLADNTGNSFGDHLHLTLKQKDAHYKNWPYNIIDPTPYMLPLLGWQEPSGPFIEGWVLASGVVVHDNLAQANPGGITIRIASDRQHIVPGGTIMVLTGRGDGNYLQVKVPKAALGMSEPTIPLSPAPSPPASLATVDGWAWADKLHYFDNQAIVIARHGINLRTQPVSGDNKIGIVRSGSTVSLLGDVEEGYQPVRVRRADFIGPIQDSSVVPVATIDSLSDLPDDVLLGWTQTQFLQRDGRYAITRHHGVSLRNQPQIQADLLGMVKGDAPSIIAGAEQNDFTPILVSDEMMFSLVNRHLTVTMPQPLSEEGPPIMPPSQPVQNTVPGWVLATDLTRNGDHTAHSNYMLYLREEPNREAKLLGLVPAATAVMVMGLPLGEFLPVRVAEDVLQTAQDDGEGEGFGMLGQALIGLHASADPDIREAEFQEFMSLRPGIIKVLSFHHAADIERLVRDHPQAVWIVRAFLDFGGRNVSPAQFVKDTQADVSRALKILAGRRLVVELHNEPNIMQEGLGSSWDNGRDFTNWWLELLQKYRRALPGIKFIYPGLSPGPSVFGRKIDHIQFIEASRPAVEAADGLGVHLYWSTVYPMQRALDVLDDYISRFRNKPIWVTEASNNKPGTAVAQKGAQYLQFWQALQQRPIVQGVTYFVASASNPAFAEEVWVGRGIGKIVGSR